MCGMDKRQALYERYMKSSAWFAKRKLVIERDGHRCQTCHSTERLEVHHATYERLSHEDLSDLITLCHDCHMAITCVIRGRRHSKNNWQPAAIAESSVKVHVATRSDSLTETKAIESRSRVVFVSTREPFSLKPKAID